MQTAMLHLFHPTRFLFSRLSSHGCTLLSRLCFFFVLSLLLPPDSVKAMDDVSPADIQASIDWPMYDDPFLPEIPLIYVYDVRLKDIWSASLKQPDVETRRRAAYEIGIAFEKGMRDLDEFVQPLIAQMEAADAHPAMILAAARTLILLDAKSAADAIFKHNELGAASGVMRGGTIGNEVRTGGIEFVLISDWALAKWKHVQAMEAWLKRAVNPATSPRVRSSAITSLGASGHALAAKVIISIALNRQYEPQSMRLHAARAAAALRDGELGDDLAPLLDGSLIDRLVAASLLQSHKDDAAIAVLLKLAEDAEPSVATLALERLLALKPESVWPMSAKLLRSDDATLRLIGAKAATIEGSAQAISTLAPMLDDLSPVVRTFVRDAMIQFDKVAALSPLVRDLATKHLQGSSWRAIEQAAIILGKVDHESSSPRLIELLAHKRGEVRMASIIALRRIALTDAAQLDAIVTHTGKEADVWLATMKRAMEQTHLPFIVNGEKDRELAQLLQLLGLARHMPAQKLMERFVPKKSGFWTEARSAAIWSIGLLYEDKANDHFTKEFVARLSDLNPNDPELLGVRRMAAVSLGRMKGQGGVKGLEVFYELERTSRQVGGACRWSLMRIKGIELPPLPARETTESGWFIQPLNEPAPNKP